MQAKSPVPFTSSVVSRGTANSVSRRPGDLTLSSRTAALSVLWQASQGCWKATRSALSLCLLTRDSQGHRREYYLCDASSKQTDSIFFLKECCMQSVECENVISDLSRACSLEGMLRQLTQPTRAEARQGRQRTRMCLHFCVCAHAHMRVMNWPLFPG